MIEKLWFEQATKLEPGEELFLPCESKKDLKMRAKNFEEYRNEYYEIDPLLASQLMTGNTFKDRRFFLVIKRITGSNLVGFKKNKNGEMEKINLEPDIYRRRRIRLMLNDNLTEEEINSNLEGGLTGEERKEFFGRSGS